MPSSSLFFSFLLPSSTSSLSPPHLFSFPFSPNISHSCFVPSYLCLSSPSLPPILFGRRPRDSSSAIYEEKPVSSSPFSEKEKPWVPSGDAVKMPTAPWMRGPLLLPAEDVIDLSRNKIEKRNKRSSNESHVDRSLTKKVRGGRSRHAMGKIVRSVAKLREVSTLELEDKDKDDAVKGANTPEFSLPLEHIVAEDGGQRRGSDSGRSMPWAKAEKMLVFGRENKGRVVTAAELTLPQELLVRLKVEARTMTKWVKAKKAGVTQDVMDEIRRTWRHGELAMVKFVEPLCRNMQRAREIVEAKTGGLVVFTKKDTLVVYKGSTHCSSLDSSQNVVIDVGGETTSAPKADIHISLLNSNRMKNESINKKHREADDTPSFCMDSKVLKSVGSFSGTLYEMEANRLLDSLGPRFIDWWWRKPLPVDADLLPEVVPGFKPPLRRCPPGLRLKLTDDELTYLRQLARPLPTHFALSRNTKLQGLAAAIVKLWEKCSIAKIAVKLGVPNTNNEKMSYELKRLTGGVLILRNKFFIILYRGKDFLPQGLVNIISEREAKLRDYQAQEEEARHRATAFSLFSTESAAYQNTVGSFAEFQDIQANYIASDNEFCEGGISAEAEKKKLEKEMRDQEHKLFLMKRKIKKSEEELSKLSSSWYPSDLASDQELLTEEESQTLRKIGLKMDEFLLLGRRGIYDGVIGSIYQHWKHREIVKVITMQKAFREITYTARLLETETGGILLTVEKLRKGYAILIYRGKNYRRPLKLLPENLLTKREALQRSLEIQRRGSLKFYAYQKKQAIMALKQRLVTLAENQRAEFQGNRGSKLDG